MNRSSQEIYEELLVLRCQQRDLQAWDELVQRWNDRLLYYIRRLIDQEQDASNALQDVWLNAFRGIRFLRDGSRLAPWLYTIARRTVINHYRRNYARQETMTSEMDCCEAVDITDERLRCENAELVHFGLSQLGLPEREALTLYFLDDLTVAEVADVIGVPEGTVKSRLFKARHDLKRILARETGRHDR